MLLIIVFCSLTVVTVSTLRGSSQVRYYNRYTHKIQVKCLYHKNYAPVFIADNNF